MTDTGAQLIANAITLLAVAVERVADSIAIHGDAKRYFDAKDAEAVQPPLGMDRS